MSENLIEGLEHEIQRNRELLDLYRSIPEGAIGAAFIDRDIKIAIHALGSGDIAERLNAYSALRDNE